MKWKCLSTFRVDESLLKLTIKLQKETADSSGERKEKANKCSQQKHKEEEKQQEDFLPRQRRFKILQLI